YEMYGAILGIPLVENPDLALKHEVALFSLVHGFKTGTFTGRMLSEFINDQRHDYINARHCINGLDKASDIALLAEQYLDESQKTAETAGRPILLQIAREQTWAVSSRPTFRCFLPCHSFLSASSPRPRPR